METRASQRNTDLQVWLNQKWSPVQKGKDKSQFDMIIGKPRMKKLGLGIDPSGFVYKKSSSSATEEADRDGISKRCECKPLSQ